jgi:hypothetical protein
MIEVLKQMVEALEWCHGGEPVGTADAIKAGKKLIAELESQYPHGMYGAEDLDKAWKSGYDNCKDQFAYLDEQEPVAWRFRSGTWFNREAHWRYINTLEGTEGLRGLEPLYTTPPQRQWVGLTEDERTAIRAGVQTYLDMTQYEYGKTVQQATELKLQEKNT